MRTSTKFLRLVALTSAILLAFGGSAFAQLQSGNVYGIVSDTQGASLPGVSVTIQGGGAPQVQVTDAQGQFRFLGLSPGTYRIEAAIDGFSTVIYEAVSVSVGNNTTIELAMQVQAAVEDVITVTSESPLLDSRKITTGSTVNATELEKIPTSRDPWAILASVPGVKTDRINVGGNESGQQSQYTGPGSTGDDAVWAMDGVVITDMAAIGSSPGYYNFDAFEEMQITTGGSDASLATSGVSLNMVTKRGTNEWRAGGRYIYGDGDWQSNLDFSQGDLGDGQEEFKQGNRIVEVEDYGVDVGGPIIEDKLWIWANYGEQNIDLLTIADVSDSTELQSYGAKLNAQLGASNSATVFYNYGDKIKIGRNAGPSRPQPTTWNQTGPTDIYKLEDTHIFGASFFVTGMYSHVGGGFQLTPQGGLDGPNSQFDEDFVWQSNFLHHDTDRPQDQVKLDGNYFFNTGDLGHELKFGVGYREADITSQSIWPGDVLQLNFYKQFGYAYNVAQVGRNPLYDVTTTYTSLYAQDTMTVGDLTINAGFRFDQQDGEINSSTFAGLPGWTDDNGVEQLPAASFDGGDQGFDWSDFAPRLGLTYALGEENNTLLRASYARFAEQLQQGFAFQTIPVNIGYAYWYYDDVNGDGRVSPDETRGFLGTNGYDITGANPTSQVDPSFEAPLTDELILGIEHSLLPELVIGATLTARNMNNRAEFEVLVQDDACVAAGGGGNCVRTHERSDYVQTGTTTGTLPDGSAYSVPIWGLRSGVSDTGGTFLHNGNREQDYLGVALTFNKRLSNRWMLRGNVTFSSWEWDIPESSREDPSLFLGGASEDGGDVLQGSGNGSGSKGGIYINSDWSYSLTGMYQVAPDRAWGFNVSAAINGREGYPVPYYLGNVNRQGLTGTANLQATENSTSFRHDDIHQVDLRVEKEVNFSDFGLTFGLEAFNLLNESTVLQREHNLNSGNADFVQEIVSPRMFRATFRFSFN